MESMVKIVGESPILMRNGDSAYSKSPQKTEIDTIISKRGRNNLTESDESRLRELETYVSLWLKGSEPTIPVTAIRSCIEAAARKTKEGPAVREGLVVLDADFRYDKERYGNSIEDICRNAQYTIGVVVQRSRQTRTRPRFDLPWECTFEIDFDEELVDHNKLEKWLDIAGRRIGLGDWRPGKSGGPFGKFKVVSITGTDA